MSRTELLKLAERVEGLIGPCRATDSHIWRALEPGGVWWDDGGTLYKRDPDDACAWGAALPFTACLNAAMTLVPEGCGITISRYWTTARKGEAWSAELFFDGLPQKPRRIYDCYDAPTPALALTAAALRARAAMETNDDG